MGEPMRYMLLIYRDEEVFHPGDRQGLPGARADHGSTPGACQGQDPRRRHPLPGAARRRLAERLDAVMVVVYLVFTPWLVCACSLG